VFGVYSIGYPLVVGRILYKNRAQAMEDQILRAKNTGDSRKTNPNCHEFRKRYSKLYKLYKPDFYFWSGVIMFRKLLIACSFLLFRKSPVFMLAFVLMTLFVAYALQVRYQPYMHDSEKAQIVSAFEARKREVYLDSKLNQKSSSKKLKFDESSTWKSGAKQASEGASKALYNFNFMEATLLFCLCLVVLNGLMFQSDQIKPGSRWQKGLTLWTFIIVMSSVAYFFGVLFVEVAAGMGYFDRQKAMKKLGLKHQEKEAVKEERSETISDMNMATANPIFGVAENQKKDKKIKELQEILKNQAEELAALKKATHAGKVSHQDSFKGKKRSGLKASGQKKSFESHKKKQSSSADEGDWKAAVSKKSGKTYYYNSKTKETRWENPNESMSLGLDTSDSGTSFASVNPMSPSGMGNALRRASVEKERMEGKV
jgi:hypothetical protein